MWAASFIAATIHENTEIDLNWRDKGLGGTTQPTETSATETKVNQVNADLGIGTPSKWYALTKHVIMELRSSQIFPQLFLMVCLWTLRARNVLLCAARVPDMLDEMNFYSGRIKGRHRLECHQLLEKRKSTWKRIPATNIHWKLNLPRLNSRATLRHGEWGQWCENLDISFCSCHVAQI